MLIDDQTVDGRQPGAGGAQPRLPARGGDRRRPSRRRSRAPSSCSQRSATRRPRAARAGGPAGEVAVLIAIVCCGADRRAAPPLERPRGDGVRAGAGHRSGKRQAAAEARPAATAPKKPKKKKVAKETKPAPDEPVDPRRRRAGAGLQVLLEAASVVPRTAMSSASTSRRRCRRTATRPTGRSKDLDTWEFHRNRFGIQGLRHQAASSTKSSTSSPSTN